MHPSLIQTQLIFHILQPENFNFQTFRRRRLARRVDKTEFIPNFLILPPIIIIVQKKRRQFRRINTLILNCAILLRRK